MPKIFYLESDEVGLHVDWFEAGEGAGHALLGREEGADGGGALGDGLVRARDGDHREGVVLVGPQPADSDAVHLREVLDQAVAGVLVGHLELLEVSLGNVPV